MSRRARLPRHLLDHGPDGRTAHTRGRTAVIAGPVATAWLAAVEAAAAGHTWATAQRRLRSARTRRVTLLPGALRAEVRQEAYRAQVVDVRVPEVDDADWERLLDAAARRSRWLAELAAGAPGPELAASLVEAGLVPSPGDLGAECTCRSGPGLCVHAVIAAHVAARALTDEPGGLLVLRGLLPDRLGPRLIGRLPGGDPRGDVVDPGGIDWAADVQHPPAPFPTPIAPPAMAGRPRPFPDPPPRSALHAGDLDTLAADAAVRAHDLLVRGGAGGLELDADADLARRAAAVPLAALPALAERARLPEGELEALAVTWRAAGAGGVAALMQRWRPSPRELEPGAAALRGLGDAVMTRLNRVATPDRRVELALGRDRLWYLLRRPHPTGAAVVVRPGHPDPLRLLSGAGPVSAAEAAAAEQLRLL